MVGWGKTRRKERGRRTDLVVELVQLFCGLGGHGDRDVVHARLQVHVVNLDLNIIRSGLLRWRHAWVDGVVEHNRVWLQQEPVDALWDLLELDGLRAKDLPPTPL